MARRSRSVMYAEGYRDGFANGLLAAISGMGLVIVTDPMLVPLMELIIERTKQRLDEFAPEAVKNGS